MKEKKTFRGLKLYKVSMVVLAVLLAVGFTACGDDKGGASSDTTVATGLTVEHRVNPMSTGTLTPRLSWKMKSEGRGQYQSAYRVIVASSEYILSGGAGDVWDSGKIPSVQSLDVKYAGPALEPQKTYYWKVKLWDQNDMELDWTDAAYFHTGIVDQSEWQGQWIGLVQVPDVYPSPYLRKEFSLSGEVSRAYLYCTALGVYEMYINGEKAGKDEMAPGFTDYNKRVQYQTYDVTSLLKKGDNAIGGILGAGWYTGEHAMNLGHLRVYGDNPCLLAQLKIEYKDGTSETMVTDSTWKATADGPISSTSNFDGETYDARKELTGWDKPGYDDSAWGTPSTFSYSGAIAAQKDQPVQVIKEIEPVDFWESGSKPGVYIFDLGQNFAGKVRLKIKGEAGQTVTLRHAEVLQPSYGKDPAGAAANDIYVGNLRTADATDIYTLKGEGTEVYVPRFTYHGFRYVEATGLSSSPSKDTITGLVMTTNTPVTGTFTTSNELVNQLQSNIEWSLRSNFFSVPTDCPQRDERAGWTADAQLFSPTATYLVDAYAFLGDKWMQDMRDAQNSETGEIPNIVPDTNLTPGTNEWNVKWGRVGWADAVIIVPYVLWQRYGQTDVITENYQAMMDYIDSVSAAAVDYIPGDNYYAWGDHLNLDDETDKTMLKTTYYAYVTGLMSEMAAAVGEEADSQTMSELSAAVKNAFGQHYVAPDGTISTGSQTAYALPLATGILDESRRQSAVLNLKFRLANNGGHLSTGFLGTPCLLPALSDNGYLEEAYDLLLLEDYPSWLYPVTVGATTMWERWDSRKEDGSYQTTDMTSFNHYAYGAVGDWMYRNIAGIRADSPGFRELTIMPRPGGGLTSAKGTLESVYGLISSEWAETASSFTLSVTVPPNTTATVCVPGDGNDSVTEGGVPAADSEGVTELDAVDGYRRFSVGSGSYSFTVVSQ